jgi:ribosomal protein S18 acetylase RimI-like enzyme
VYALEPATPADLDWLFALHEAALGAYVAALWGWDEAWQRRHFGERLELANTRLILVGGERAGRLTLTEREDHIFLDYLALLPAQQNRGVGTAVLRDVLEAARAEGKPVKLSVLRPNPAIRLYERLGFVVTAADAQRIHMARFFP